MKHTLTIIAVLMVILSTTSLASSSGITRRTTLNTAGCGPGGCHGGSPSARTRVTVPQAVDGKLSVQLGGTISLTLRVEHNSLSFAGANISVNTERNGTTAAGTLAAVDNGGLRLSQGQLTHSTPRSGSGGVVTFEFTWTAPRTEGTYYLHAIGNAVNRNGGTSGDEWNWLDPIEITVSPSVSVNEPMAAVPAVRLYPVPAHGDVTVSAATLDDVVQVVVTSPTGERVFSTTTTSNMQQVEFVWAGRTNDGTPVPPGTYSVAILGRNTRVMGRAVIIR
jgi:hypothetical protein